MDISDQIIKVAEGQSHNGHIPQHRAKPMTRQEKVIRHICSHCVHFVGFTMISIVPIALWEKIPEIITYL